MTKHPSGVSRVPTLLTRPLTCVFSGAIASRMSVSPFESLPVMWSHRVNEDEIDVAYLADRVAGSFEVTRQLEPLCEMHDQLGVAVGSLDARV